jgi:hypothetical protein
MESDPGQATECSFSFPLHQHALDAAVGNGPQEADDHIQAVRNPRTHEREREGVSIFALKDLSK